MIAATVFEQLRNAVLATAGLALIFGLPAIIIRAWNTRGEKRKK